jgi:hypothetical protein
MGRSGTSLLARIVAAVPIPMGFELVGPNPNNPYGHFEDREIVELHKRILERDLGHNWIVSRTTRFGKKDSAHAKRLIARRQPLATWGFKDPRTSLFLPDWDALLSDPIYLFVWRPCAEVVASCAKRSRLILPPWRSLFEGSGGMRRRVKHTSRAFMRQRAFTNAWLLYNRCILDFLRNGPPRAVLVRLADLVSDPDDIVKHLIQFGALKKPVHNSMRHLVDPRILTRGAQTKIIPAACTSRVKQLERQLMERS